MKKIMLSLLIILTTFFVVGCNGEKSVDIDKLVSNLEKIEGEYLSTTDNYYNPSSYSFVENKVTGLLNTAIYDFNNDGNFDVLLSKIENNDIVLKLYELDDDELKLSDSIVLFEDYLDFPDTIDFDCFVKIIDDVPYVFAESISYSNLIADGLNWIYRKVGFSNDKFFDIAKDELSASYVDDDTLKEKKSFVEESELSVDKLVFEENGKSLFNQNSNNAVLLFQIKREHLDSFNPELYYDSQETNVKYGITSYTNKLDKDNHIEAYLK